MRKGRRKGVRGKEKGLFRIKFESFSSSQAKCGTSTQTLSRKPKRQQSAFLKTPPFLLYYGDETNTGHIIIHKLLQSKNSPFLLPSSLVAHAPSACTCTLTKA